MEVCPHYWVIDDAEGPTSVGQCKYCGEFKDFPNYIDPNSYEPLQGAPHLSSWVRMRPPPPKDEGDE